jgi:hypothetical protein
MNNQKLIELALDANSYKALLVLPFLLIVGIGEFILGLIMGYD